MMSDSEAVARDEFFDSLLGDFLDESGQLLDRLNENLLQLDEWVRTLEDEHEERCDESLLNEMFRSAHSLKGLSAMLGLKDINHLTHKIENVFDAARKDELIMDGDVVETMFQAVDRLVSLVDVLKDPDLESVECESVLECIAELLQSAGVERKQSSQADAERALAEVAAEAGMGQDGPEAEAAPSETEPVPDAGEAPDSRKDTPKPTPESQTDPFDGLENDTEVAGTYLSIFIDESEMSLDSLTETLLVLEGGGRREELQSLLVTSHRIKGSAASVGLNRAAKLAHFMEDLLQNLVETGGTLSAELTDAMLKCTDALRQYLDDLKKGNAPPDNFSQLARELLAAQTARTSPGVPSAQPQAADAGDLGQPPAAASGRQEAGPAGISSELRSQVAAVLPEETAAYVGEVTFQPDLHLVSLKAQLIYEKLASLGDVCYFHPPIEELEELERLDRVSFGVTAEKPLVMFYQQLRISGLQETIIEPLAVEQGRSPAAGQATSGVAKAGDSCVPAAPAQGPKAANTESTPATEKAKRIQPGEAASQTKGHPADAGNRPTETLRVDVERLDQLMNLAGELAINKARFSRIGDSLKVVLGNKQSVQALGRAFNTLDKMTVRTNAGDDSQCLQKELENLQSQARRIQNDLETVRREVRTLAGVHGSINDLFETIHELDRVSDGIQRNVMDTRMIPIGPLFTRFKRVIRDITRTNGKSIRLVINGEKTELDKRMIDELGDPLIHMVRNSADHGIEPPEVRKAAGKPQQGTVTLDAFHRGNSIIIRVTDDGKGLDPDSILRKALDKGIISELDAEKMTTRQIYRMIWEPGLSTAEKVTEVSGRGMGMDIVKSKIEEMNGTVDLDSVPGKGTTLTIKLPLTLAILPSLMVEIDGDVLAMPLEGVEEIVSVRKQDLTTVHGQSTARVRGRVISVVMLDELLTWNQTSQHGGVQDRDETTLVIVGETGQEIGLAVDRVLGEEDVVIKSMAENYRNVAGIAGASILGDGRVSLILDVTALIDMTSKKTTTVAAS